MSKNSDGLSLGVTLQGIEPPAAFQEQVKDVVDGGYTHLWITDSSLHARYVYAYLTMAALQSDDLMLATGVTHPFTRHPAMTVNAIATLDEISGGRAILGLGAGDRPTAELGFSPSRLDVLRDMIQISRRLLAGQKVNYQGPSFSLIDAELHFDYNGQVPIYMACSGPRMLALAGELADGVVAQCGIFPGAIEFARSCVAEGAERAGRSTDEIDIWLMACGSLDEDHAGGLDRSRAMAAWFAQTAPHCCDLAGIDPNIVRNIQDAYRGGEFHLARDAAALVPDEMVELFTVGGSPEKVADRLAPMTTLGIKGINFMPIGPERTNSVRLFSQRVAKPLALGRNNG